jgi:hypothetical protein
VRIEETRSSEEAGTTSSPTAVSASCALENEILREARCS